MTWAGRTTGRTCRVYVHSLVLLSEGLEKPCPGIRSRGTKMSEHGSEAWSGGLRSRVGGSGVEATVSRKQQDVKGWRGMEEEGVGQEEERGNRTSRLK